MFILYYKSFRKSIPKRQRKSGKLLKTTFALSHLFFLFFIRVYLCLFFFSFLFFTVLSPPLLPLSCKANIMQIRKTNPKKIEIDKIEVLFSLTVLKFSTALPKISIITAYLYTYGSLLFFDFLIYSLFIIESTNPSISNFSFHQLSCNSSIINNLSFIFRVIVKHNSLVLKS